MAYSILFAPAANRQFRKLTLQVQKRLKPHIDALAEAACLLSGYQKFY
ncbi:MAG: hypothetical protein WCB68_18150 [Pyrinomonadaceae bacterium]